MKGLAAVGDVLAGKYRVDKILGIGGMGMVVAATHLELDQRVALKFMLPGSSESAESSSRFLREARAAGRLNSDHVCRVMDVGRFDSGAPYIVMEYLQGENLAAVLRKRGPLRVSEAVDYILQGIEGLAEAHAHGIVHRDLKPDNLFLHKRNDGGAIVKVLDFGISKVSISGLATRTGDIMGSPAYMAPEQMESTRSVDQRADVWSLGVVLYQLVTGKAPFHGETMPLLCLHVVNDEPTAMSEIRGDLPDGFEAVVMRCLRKEPDERFRDVGELAQALAPFGPKHATTSASRIQIVLRRTRAGSSPLIGEAPVAAARVDERTVRVSPIPGGLPGAVAAGAPRSRGLAGVAAGGVVLVAVAVVIAWRIAGGGASVVADPAGPAPRPPPPIVEPIEEPGVEPGAAGAGAQAAVAPAPLAVEPAPGAVPAAEPAPGAAPVGAAVEPAPAAPAAAAAIDPGPAPSAVEPAPPGATAPSDRRRRKRRGAGPVRAGKGSAAGSAADVRAGSDADAGEDDDKWMHMTHDEDDDKDGKAGKDKP